jgi:hypothetical protein
MNLSAKQRLLQGSAVRAAYGTTALLFPKQLAAAGGMKEEDVDLDARYLNRLFGARDILVAALTVAQVRSGDEAGAAKLNLVAEATDTLALIEEVRSRGGLDRTLFIGLVFNLFGYATWIRALQVA